MAERETARPEGRVQFTVAALVTLAVWWVFVQTVAVSLLFFLLRSDVPAELVFLNALLLVALFAMARPQRPRGALTPRCAACSAQVYPTRLVEGSRVWTCFRCGAERPRPPRRDVGAAGRAAVEAGSLSPRST